MSVYELWRSRREKSVKDRLASLGQIQQVDDFVSTYASSLADRILNLLEAGAIEEAAEAPAHFLEELGRQTESFLESVAGQAVSERQAAAALPGTESAEPAEYALAA